VKKELKIIEYENFILTQVTIPNLKLTLNRLSLGGNTIIGAYALKKFPVRILLFLEAFSFCL